MPASVELNYALWIKAPFEIKKKKSEKTEKFNFVDNGMYGLSIISSILEYCLLTLHCLISGISERKINQLNKSSSENR